ncbi:SDR family NAD(P)-dependent oxidoreductase [Tepidanaerobacter syntrophicus]|uniref:3-oxoacyl-[acyl-carrier protein] reductase n=1 Tax=Tepidanaerobacter syntrophicus TaxID=224999 RepID=A0A0U9HH86_9FIRM|nr:SDR family NAD(P)-dependent oxidoreductase [Tepidanaerobacter syntrophicus]GAQ25268.1 3-oxoacyl-[acyl-carrier protein] reductase [Tepidanaerobacter syntrophicus]
MKKDTLDYLGIGEKTAIVTGGGRGIGRAISISLARYGVKVVVCDINDKNGNSTLNEITSHGDKGTYFQCDVSNPLQVRQLSKFTAETFGGIDIVVNNAGIGSVSIPFEQISDEEWDKMLRVNLTGPFYVCKETIPYMKTQKHGKIVNISSGSGIIGAEFCAHYAASKAGLIGFTQSIAKELGPFKINANVIAVPTTETPMLAETNFDVFVEDELKEIPWGRIGTPQDVANMVLYLSSDASEYVTGQVLAPNGGRRTPI